MSAVPSFLGSSNRNMPDVLQAYILDHLSKEDLQNLKLTSTSTKHFVEKKHRELSIFRDPEHLGKLRTYEDLTPAQKLELEFIRFNDRPVWQQVLIVVGCIFLSPAIFLYHSPKIIEQTCVYILAPIGSKVLSCIHAVYHHVLTPVGRFTYTYVLSPVMQAVHKAAIGVFVTLPCMIYEHVLTPIGHGIETIVELSYDHLLAPLGRAVMRVAEAVLFDLPEWVYQNVLVHFGGGLKRVAIWTFDQVIAPLARVLHEKILVPLGRMIQRALEELVATGIKVCEHIIKPVAIKALQLAEWLFENILIPLGDILSAVAKGLFVTFPWKVYVNVLTPIGHVIEKVAQFIFQYLLTPLGDALQFLGRVTYQNVITPVVLAIEQIAQFVFNQLIVPFVQLIEFGAEVLYDHLLLPVGCAIAAAPYFVGKFFR